MSPTPPAPTPSAGSMPEAPAIPETADAAIPATPEAPAIPETAATADAAAPKAPASLRYLPVGAFATVMGTAGLAAAWDMAAHAWGVPEWISRAWAVAALAVFAVVAVAYAAKVIRHPHAARAEWRDPVQSAFTATFSVALLVLAIAYEHWLPGLAAALWWTGAGAQAIITLLVVRGWIATPITREQIHPAWFIPAVGNLVAPIAGAGIAPGAVAWYFFGVGLVYWLALLPVVLSRLFTAGPLPARLLPTLAILAAPPSVAAASWVALGGSWNSAPVHVLLAVVVFQVLLFAVQSPALRHVPFAITWWACTFPLAAASRVLIGSGANDGVDYDWFAAPVFAVTNVVVLVLAGRTAVGAVRGEILRPAR